MIWADWPTPRLMVLYRIAKTRCRPFFRHPHLMIALRQEVNRRRGRHPDHPDQNRHNQRTDPDDPA